MSVDFIAIDKVALSQANMTVVRGRLWDMVENIYFIKSKWCVCVRACVRGQGHIIANNTVIFRAA